MAERHRWDWVRATREHPEHVPATRMHKTWKTRWDVEKGQGPSHCKSQEELAATAWEGELCNDRGSGRLQAWLPDTPERKSHWSGQGGSAAVGSRPGLGSRAAECAAG